MRSGRPKGQLSTSRRHRVAVGLVTLTTILAIVGLLHDESSLSAALDVYEVTSWTQRCSQRDHARIQAFDNASRRANHAPAHIHNPGLTPE